MKNTPLISIIVPVYNTERYLSKCIESIVNQTYMNMEIILINDGSTDSSGKICDEYAKKDNRIQVIHKENEGQASARNVALDLTQGEYVGFVDSDDYIHPQMYAFLYEHITAYHAQIAICGRTNVDEANRAQTPLFTFDEAQKWDNREALKHFLTSDHLDGSPCDKLIERGLIGETRFPIGYICEDLPFVYHVLKNAATVVHVGKALYYYLQRSGSTSRSPFSEKTMGLAIYAWEIANHVKKYIPELGKESDYYYIRNTYIMARRFYDIMDAGKKREMTHDVKKILKKLLFNPYFKFVEKIWLLVFAIGLYPFMRRIYKRIRKKQ